LVIFFLYLIYTAQRYWGDQINWNKLSWTCGTHGGMIHKAEVTVGDHIALNETALRTLLMVRTGLRERVRFESPPPCHLKYVRLYTSNMCTVLV